MVIFYNFQVFFSVVVFGLFHGLAFLPVVLSLVGAKAYKHSDEVPSSVSVRVNTSSKENHAEKQMEPVPAGFTEVKKRRIVVVSLNLQNHRRAVAGALECCPVSCV